MGEILEEFNVKSIRNNQYVVLSSTNNGMEIRTGRVSGKSNIGYKVVNTNDLILSPQNLWLGNININHIGIGLVSPSYKTFKIINVGSTFIEPQLRMYRMLNEYKNASTQGASVVRRNLEIELFYQIPIYVPKLQEQQKIGKFFKQLDSLITLHQRRKHFQVFFDSKLFILCFYEYLLARYNYYLYGEFARYIQYRCKNISEMILQK